MEVVGPQGIVPEIDMVPLPGEGNWKLNGPPEQGSTVSVRISFELECDKLTVPSTITSRNKLPCPAPVQKVSATRQGVQGVVVGAIVVVGCDPVSSVVSA